jgi:hypothetical protein
MTEFEELIARVQAIPGNGSVVHDRNLKIGLLRACDDYMKRTGKPIHPEDAPIVAAAEAIGGGKATQESL